MSGDGVVARDDSVGVRGRDHRDGNGDQQSEAAWDGAEDIDAEQRERERQDLTDVRGKNSEAGLDCSDGIFVAVDDKLQRPPREEHEDKSGDDEKDESHGGENAHEDAGDDDRCHVGELKERSEDGLGAVYLMERASNQSSNDQVADDGGDQCADDVQHAEGVGDIACRSAEATENQIENDLDDNGNENNSQPDAGVVLELVPTERDCVTDAKRLR